MHGIDYLCLLLVPTGSTLLRPEDPPTQHKQMGIKSGAADD
ncbi:MAG TPA: hypothetical protein V6D14_03630 [Coleofasciculaceae cyanobacterium]